jgi:hypothetical protein
MSGAASRKTRHVSASVAPGLARGAAKAEPKVEPKARVPGPIACETREAPASLTEPERRFLTEFARLAVQAAMQDISEKDNEERNES